MCHFQLYNFQDAHKKNHANKDNLDWSMGFQAAASDWSVGFQAVISDWSMGFQAALLYQKSALYEAYRVTRCEVFLFG